MHAAVCADRAECNISARYVNHITNSPCYTNTEMTDQGQARKLLQDIEGTRSLEPPL